MPVTAIDDVLDVVDEIFWRNRSLVDAIVGIDLLVEKYAQLARDQKHWIIGKAQMKVVKHLKNETSPELLHALAQRIPLEPSSIFDYLGFRPEFPEVDVALVDNLLRYDRILDHDADLDGYLRDCAGDENLDDHMITIVEDILRRGDDWECWTDALNTVLAVVLYRDDNEKYRHWLKLNESRIIDIDGSYRLCSQWDFRSCFKLYDWGLEQLGRMAMGHSGPRAKNFEFLTHEALMDPEQTERNFAFLDKQPSLCFLLATTSPIEGWMNKRLDFTELANCLDIASKEYRDLDPSRVTYAALQASEKLIHWQLPALLKRLSACGYLQSSESMSAICTNVAKRYMGDAMVFCKLYTLTREYGADLDMTNCPEWPMTTLLDGARKLVLTLENAVELLNNSSAGMQLPRTVIEVAVGNSYGSWALGKQNEFRRFAPEWLISNLEQLRADQLCTDFGL